MSTTAPPSEMLTAAHRADVEAIRGIIDDVAAGVTAKDPDRCVARFAPDARSVVASGVRSVGRDAIRAAHVAAFAAATTPPAARFALVDLVFPRPDVALATTEASGGPGGPTAVVTWLLTREDDGWWISARQFTRVAR